jgi:thiosulfate/3-mercaptopyruvate sulfurtransferase
MSDTDVPALVTPEWLEPRLDDPDLRVVDCTVYLRTDADGELRAESGRSDWAEKHIPGSVFVDLIEDLSETDDPEYAFQLPEPAAFAAEMEAAGIGDDTRVVAYDDPSDDRSNEWAARLWWMLRAFGHDEVGVLDGGLTRWVDEGRPTTAAAPATREVTFTPEFRPELVAGKDDVLAYTSADTDAGACVLNALRPADHETSRIPNTDNVPAVGDSAVIDPETNTYRSKNELRERFEAVGATGEDRVVTYCGGGIAASSTALAAYTAGIEDIAVYDGSLREWRSDPDLPLEGDS